MSDGYNYLLDTGVDVDDTPEMAIYSVLFTYQEQLYRSWEDDGLRVHYNTTTTLMVSTLSEEWALSWIENAYKRVLEKCKVKDGLFSIYSHDITSDAIGVPELHTEYRVINGKLFVEADVE